MAAANQSSLGLQCEECRVGKEGPLNTFINPGVSSSSSLFCSHARRGSRIDPCTEYIMPSR